MQRRLGIPFTALALLAWACGPAQIGPEGGSIGTGPCAEAPLRTTGTTYYYCDCQSGAASGCVAGKDSDPGTSPSAPRQSFADAQSRFRSMAAGSTVALCRGGAWTATGGLIDNPSCTTSRTTARAAPTATTPCT